MTEVEELYVTKIRGMAPQARLRLASMILNELTATGEEVNASPVRQSLRGLWRGLDISEEDIAEARREMWTAGRSAKEE